MHEITIRKAHPGDAEKILEIYSYYILNTAITFEYDVPSVSEFRGRIEKISERYPYLAAELDGRIIGYAYAHEYIARHACDWSAELSVYVDKDYKKQGVGKALYSELERALKAMGIINLYASIAVPEVDDEHLNRNSLEFHKHLGYREIGTFEKCGYKFGKWYNLTWVGKTAGIHSEKPAEVVNFNRLEK